MAIREKRAKVAFVTAAVTFALAAFSGQTPASDAPSSHPFEIVGRHIFIDVIIGDTPLCFVFDTGASSTVIDTAAAAAIGLEPTRDTVAMGSSGRVRTGHRAGNRLTVGDVTLDGIDLVFVPLDHLSRRVGRRIDGILGFDLLSRYTVTIDNTARRLIVRSLGSYVPGEGFRKWSFRMDMRIPTIEATVELHDGERLRGRFLVDTGAGISLALNTPFVDRHRLLERVETSFEAPYASLGGATHTGVESRVAGYRVFGTSFADVPASLSRVTTGVKSMSAFAGILGNEVLRRFDLTFDYGRRAVWVRPNEALKEPFRVDCSGLGLELAADMGSILIHTVIDGSPAHDAGVAAGDELLALNGEAVAGSPLHQIRDRLRRSGDRVAVSIWREGTVVEKQLELRDLR